MIICEHIKKAYVTQMVFEDFSYVFKDTGFYLLFGESGSGKTTLLNMLAGHISYDDGYIHFIGEKYATQLNAEAVSGEIDYITQDANFIEYLSVYDNLALCTADDNRIQEYLDRFNLTDKKDMFPGKLSGGERQRICLIRSLIQGKRIILLDEPTASLDNENKKFVFETLKELKASVMIICSSHDEVAKEYADEIIDFNMLEKYREPVDLEKHSSHIETKTAKVNTSKRRVGKYIRKWFKSPFKEKRSRVSFFVIMLLALMAICMGDIPENKFDSSIEYIYGLNQIRLSIEEDKLDYMEALYLREEINEIVMEYEGSVPEGKSLDDPDNPLVYADYELAVWTLPEKAENIHIDDFLAYGRYIENEDEIILSDAMALKLGNPEKLIGETMKIKLYDGEHLMTIVGIFKEFTDVERQYLYNAGMLVFDEKDLYDDRYAISAKYTNKYLGNKDFVKENGRRVYTLYFDSYSEMKEFWNEVYVDIKDAGGVFFSPPSIELSMKHVFDMMYKNIFPVAILIMLIAVIFYYQTQKTELMHNRKIFVTFQYLGYSIKQVKRVWMIYSVVELAKFFVLSGIANWVITYIVNSVNRRVELIPFEIFTYNAKAMLIMFVAIMVVGVVNSYFMLHKLRPENISENLVEQRDLL